jgi:hypothetical protein
MADLEQIIGKLGTVTVGEVRKALENVPDFIVLNADSSDNLCFDLLLSQEGVKAA